jgi:molybdopterin synthase catalytic subunit
MTLEHYSGMAEQQLSSIVTEATSRWPVDDILVVHRYGDLKPGDPIVLVAAASAHRDPAFDACRFLMDWLKTQAPFWKKEISADGANWVEAKASDDVSAARWKSQ